MSQNDDGENHEHTHHDSDSRQSLLQLHMPPPPFGLLHADAQSSSLLASVNESVASVGHTPVPLPSQSTLRGPPRN